MSTRKLVPLPIVEPQPRPHAEYRGDFIARILALEPTSVLDLGCGEGSLIEALRKAGVEQCAGIEPEEITADRARRKGIDVHVGLGEHLPFDDGSFDVVTLEYVTHHLADLRRGLREALRVARRAIVILDCWYDDRIRSQRVARRYDEWTKRIDRMEGFVHNPCPRPDALIEVITSARDVEIDFSCRLIMRPLSLAMQETQARARLPVRSPALEQELETILDEAKRFGMTDDGALILAAAAR